jgi:allantoate deiminase
LTAADQVLDLCARIAACTDVPGTITRTFLSPATRRVHALLQAEMEALGMAVRTDAAGNLRGVYAGTHEGVLLMGSHIDTVPDSGSYDGVLGVAMAIVLIRMLGGRRLSYAIEVIAFSEEEGVRFKLPFIGSRALVGTLDAALLARTDADGVTVAQAIRDFGLDPDELAHAVLTPGTFAFFEAHIEQGPVLESLGLPLGIVTSIIGQTRLGITFHGEANHAGTTPMRFRKDALAAAARWIAGVAQHPNDDPALLATVGSIEALPGAGNVIPGEVTCSLDVRHASDAARLAAVAALMKRAEACAQTGGVSVTFADRGGQPSVPMDARLQRLLEEAAPGAHAMPSGAGHDAMILAPHVPTAMLFLRTPRGLSHHPEEAVRVEDVQAALAACMRFFEALQENKTVSRAESDGQL